MKILLKTLTWNGDQLLQLFLQSRDFFAELNIIHPEQTTDTGLTQDTERIPLPCSQSLLVAFGLQPLLCYNIKTVRFQSNNRLFFLISSFSLEPHQPLCHVLSTQRTCSTDRYSTDLSLFNAEAQIQGSDLVPFGTLKKY